MKQLPTEGSTEKAQDDSQKEDAEKDLTTTLTQTQPNNHDMPDLSAQATADRDPYLGKGSPSKKQWGIWHASEHPFRDILIGGFHNTSHSSNAKLTSTRPLYTLEAIPLPYRRIHRLHRLLVLQLLPDYQPHAVAEFCCATLQPRCADDWVLQLRHLDRGIYRPCYSRSL